MTAAERNQDASERFEERAAIIEHDAGLSRAEAERRAKAEVAAWLKAHPETEAND